MEVIKKMSFVQKGLSQIESYSSGQHCSRELCPPDCVCFSEEFCAALDGNFIPQYIINPNTFVVCYCNQALRDVLKKDVHGRLCYKELRGKDAPCEDCPALRYYHKKDNKPKLVKNMLGSWLMIHASPVHWQGETLIMLTCVDIDRQKKLETELELRNQEYSAVIRQSITGVMRYDIMTDVAAVNVDVNLQRVEEYTIPYYSQMIRKSRWIVPDSRGEVDRILKDVKNGIPSKGYDIQLSLPEGSLRWCHVDYILVLDRAGNPNRAVFSFFDNTEQREKETAHQNWNNRLEALMKKYTAYMEVNLTEDIIVSEGRNGEWHRDLGGRRFSDFVIQMRNIGIFKEDRWRFETFFNRERLMGQYLIGQTEAKVEYRAIVDGVALWFRAELMMVQDPVTNDLMASILYSNVDTNMREKERLTREAERDIMTGLYNHATAENLINKVLDQDTKERCCLLIVDLDDLRIINSDLGHPEGDRALKHIADQMVATFDAKSIMGRIGGDEFVVLLRDVPEMPELKALVERFMEGMRACRIGPKNDRETHVSIGGAVGLVGEHDFKALYRQADLALFYTKARGKNGFHLYVPEMEYHQVTYKPRSSVSLMQYENLDPIEVQKLLKAVAEFFPMIVSANLTKNRYYMIEYQNYSAQHSKDEGEFDVLIREGCESFHPEDRDAFLACFARENLLRAYAEGRRTVQHVGRQKGDDGVYRLVQIAGMLLEDEATGDICEMSFTHVIPAATGGESGGWVKRFPALDIWEREP